MTSQLMNLSGYLEHFPQEMQAAFSVRPFFHSLGRFGSRINGLDREMKSAQPLIQNLVRYLQGPDSPDQQEGYGNPFL